MPATADCSVELSLPLRPDLGRVLRALDDLAPAIPVVGLTDNHAGRARLSPLAAIPTCLRRGVRPVVHLNCRDRNRLGLRQQAVGAAAMGASGILVVRGDPLPDQPGIGVSVLEVLQRLPAWTAPDPLPRGAVVNPFAPVRREMALLERKAAAGVEFLQTQMVFDLDALDRFLLRVDQVVPTAVPIFASVGVLRSERMLTFVRERLRDCPIPEPAARRIRAGEGVELATELAAAIGARPRLRLHVIPLGAETAVRRIARAYRSQRSAAEAALPPVAGGLRRGNGP
ncbi:MAG TPA: methylenetetrahydrofolate reductase [Candidatus Micrarchaeia archaeon]|nr:methylenetetrahydrofolate reductase [Candidatus Micrarchaeia archaeon]